MTQAVQQSLFDAGGGAPMVESARWFESMMLGEIALGVCVIAVAFIGALMLIGRLPLREGARVVVGCFILLGAPVIAAGFVGAGLRVQEVSASTPRDDAQIEDLRRELPHANYDPYAGASLGQN